MGTRVPPPLLAIAQTVGLREWVSSRKFPHEKYFASIEQFKTELAPYSTDGTIDADSLIFMLCGALDAEGALLTLVLGRNAEIGDEDQWAKYLKAAAWLIYQRYVREVESKAGAGANG